MFCPSHQPPCSTRTISTRSPGRSAVASHAVRGTTAPLTATAIPVRFVCSAFTATSAASVSAVSGSLSPLTEIVGAMIFLSFICCSLRRPREREAFNAKRRKRRISNTVKNESGDEIRGDRREQNSVAMVPRGIDQPRYLRCTQNGRIITAARSMTDPHLVDRQFLYARDNAPG